jgi:hypothetical protein
MARYHLTETVATVPAGGTFTVPFGPESQTNVCENVALWLEGESLTAWTVKFNNVSSASTGAYTGGVAKKVYTEAGPLATMRTYPSVLLSNGGGAPVKVTVIWTALVRQDNG